MDVIAVPIHVILLRSFISQQITKQSLEWLESKCSECCLDMLSRYWVYSARLL